MAAAAFAVLVFASFMGAVAHSSTFTKPVLQNDARSLRIDYYRQVMANDEDMSYTVDMWLGDQAMRGIIDTGSFEIVVFGKHCTSTDCQSAKEFSKFYDNKKSPSYKGSSLKQTLSYGSGDVSTQLGYDTIQLGQSAVKNVYFWEALQAKMPLMKNAEFQAIVGVGPPLTKDVFAARKAGQATEIEKELPKDRMTKDLMDRIVSAKDIANQSKNMKTILEQFDTTLFSVCLQPKSGAEGWFTWNQEDPASYPEVHHKMTVTDPDYWSSSLRGVMLKGGKTSSEDKLGCNKVQCTALLDSGTSLLAVPSDVLNLLTAALNKIPDVCEDIHQLPDLVFELGGKTHTLPPSSYIGEVYGEFSAKLAPYVPHWQSTKSQFRQKGHRACQLLIMSSPEPHMWILGMPFFRAYFTTFDLGSDPKATAEQRLIYTAVTDEICSSPTMATESGMAAAASLQRELRRVDASKVQVSGKGWDFMHNNLEKGI